jgi:ribosomal protein S18 acetylase RimI-like enzyme
MSDMNVRFANAHDAKPLSVLFDAYRQFYAQTSNIALAETFISERINHKESVIFVAENNTKKLVGFCQIYPSFCSIAAAKISVLYDLFVDPTARNTGVGRALMLAVHAYAAKNGMARLDLSTAKTNINAQKLYESLGWVRDEIYFYYSLETSIEIPKSA